MRPGLEYQGGELGRARADCRRIAKDPFDGPRGIAPMRARHLLGDGRVAASPDAAQVHGNVLTFAEQLDAPAPAAFQAARDRARRGAIRGHRTNRSMGHWPSRPTEV